MWWNNQIISSNGTFLQNDCACCDCIAHTPGITLDQFYKEMCINQFFGWQMSQNPNETGYHNTPIPSAHKDQGNCNPLVYERCNRGCQIAGRQDICDAIIEAERMIAQQMNWWPTPHQVCDEFSFPCGILRGEISLNFGKVLALGTIAFDQIGSVTVQDADITDTNNDGVLDTITVNVAKPSGITDLSEVVILLDDGCDTGSCGRELQPICVSQHPTDTALLVVTIPVWLMVDRKYYDWANPKPIDPNNLDVYMRTINFYRKYVDGRGAVRVMRKVNKCGCSTSTEGCFECDTSTACIVDSNRGVISLDLSGGECGCDKCADRLCIRYVAGFCDHSWDRWVARLAASIINRDVCCDAQGSLVKYWAQEFIQTDSRGKITTPLSAGEAANPFGTRRAAVELWRQLRGKKRRKLIVI